MLPLRVASSTEAHHRNPIQPKASLDRLRVDVGRATEKHLEHVHAKLGVTNRVAAIAAFRESVATAVRVWRISARVGQ